MLPNENSVFVFVFVCFPFGFRFFAKISNFNWPGLGPGRLGGRDGSAGPSPGQLKIEIFKIASGRRKERAIGRWGVSEAGRLGKT